MEEHRLRNTMGYLRRTLEWHRHLQSPMPTIMHRMPMHSLTRTTLRIQCSRMLPNQCLVATQCRILRRVPSSKARTDTPRPIPPNPCHLLHNSPATPLAPPTPTPTCNKLAPLSPCNSPTAKRRKRRSLRFPPPPPLAPLHRPLTSTPPPPLPHLGRKQMRWRHETSTRFTSLRNTLRRRRPLRSRGASTRKRSMRRQL